jgi:Fasciclin domain
MNMKYRLLALSGLAVSLSLGAAACSSSSSSPAASGATSSPASSPTAVSSSPATAAKDFGPGCAAVPKSGAGSFAKIPPATLKKLLANKAELTKILTYHVAPARYTPAQLSSGTAIKTLEGGMVTPAAMGSTYEVNKANVVCGNVQTANATVYIIDTVLMPPAH